MATGERFTARRASDSRFSSVPRAPAGLADKSMRQTVVFERIRRGLDLRVDLTFRAIIVIQPAGRAGRIGMVQSTGLVGVVDCSRRTLDLTGKRRARRDSHKGGRTERRHEKSSVLHFTFPQKSPIGAGESISSRRFIVYGSAPGFCGAPRHTASRKLRARTHHLARATQLVREITHPTAYRKTTPPTLPSHPENHPSTPKTTPPIRRNLSLTPHSKCGKAAA